MTTEMPSTPAQNSNDQGLSAEQRAKLKELGLERERKIAQAKKLKPTKTQLSAAFNEAVMIMIEPMEGHGQYTELLLTMTIRLSPVQPHEYFDAQFDLGVDVFLRNLNFWPHGHILRRHSEQVLERHMKVVVDEAIQVANDEYTRDMEKLLLRQTWDIDPTHYIHIVVRSPAADEESCIRSSL